ncbi:Holliday junction branch migration protein RuvA [Corynebacterium pseudopelargi]|uniref:Holliday junction branch migration complex subunit RuvA n=1 Tax=Corynebacterium pseudopelargi TaxID=2080757 RepID=A0A3G6ITS7_9CORY|nr:Holliday junction branch migration protein RuvA [Corynebacterium pseudopelargi]AZA09155.1 Holliday junction ATP-dependent DNA helicase RuvA [Corynebacterium pseudopelargi]
MIAYLRGIISEIALDRAVIECAGVGYEVWCSPRTLGRLQRGEEAKVITSQVIREDQHLLYGFLEQEEKEMFHLLQSVSGLGPRLALAAQAVFSCEEIAQHIRGGDAKALQQIPGVGKRTAERMVVDLKDKVGNYVDAEAPVQNPATQSARPGVSEAVLEALIGLGFSEKVAQPALEAVLQESPDMDASRALHATLNVLGRR